MKQLNEKVAIVTGAGQGIGKGIALCLAKRGVKVIATGRRVEPIEQTIAEIKELGGEGFAMTCDSADRARVEEVVKAAAEKYGTVDVVVNNAQAIVPSAPVEETSYDNMLKAWQSGVIGSLNYMQAAFPYMKEQHEGRIINFASATGMFGIAGQLAYGSNKLRGMFAFVIWDSEKETLFGARDFFGIKPFYYTVADGNMIYGSEIKSILEHPAYKKEVNPVALENYLTFQYSVLDETFFKGIFKLMPGHCFTFHKGELNIERYWEPTFDADESKSLDEFVDEIDDVMHDSVEHHKIRLLLQRAVVEFLYYSKVHILRVQVLLLKRIIQLPS
jgi:hypothetical protein